MRLFRQVVHAHSMKLKYFNNRGQTLVEALIALSIIVVIMSGTTIALVSSLNNAGFVKSQNQVNKISQQGMEYIRDQIVNNNMYTAYTTSPYRDTTRCMGPNFNIDTAYSITSLPVDSFCLSQIIDGKFLRTVAFWTSRCAPGSSGAADFNNGLQVTVTTYWSDSKCNTNRKYCHNQQIVSCFINPAKTAPTTAPTGI